MFLRRDLVTGHLENRRVGADKGNAVFGGSLGQIGVLAQEAITRINGVSARLLGHANDFGNIEVRANGVTNFTNLIGLVGLETVR